MSKSKVASSLVSTFCSGLHKVKRICISVYTKGDTGPSIDTDEQMELELADELLELADKVDVVVDLACAAAKGVGEYIAGGTLEPYTTGAYIAKGFVQEQQTRTSHRV